MINYLNIALTILGVVSIAFWFYLKYTTEGETTPTETNSNPTPDSPKPAGKGEHPEKKKSTFEKVFDGIFNLFTVLIGGSMAVVAVMFAVWVYGKATAPAVSPYRDRVAETQPRKPSGMSPYSYTFDSGCVEVDLPGRWSSYPLGGKIKFIHISTGRTVLEIVPGVETNSGLMPGWYRICPADSKATGVEIWK